MGKYCGTLIVLRDINNSMIYIYFRKLYINSSNKRNLFFFFSEDAGTYACTATNSLGSTVTSATLQVPGNRRSVYAPI